MPTTLKPTPGRKSPQNLTKKLVSLEFSPGISLREWPRCLKMQFFGRLKAFFITLLYSMWQHWLQGPACLELKPIWSIFSSLAFLPPWLGQMTVAGSPPRRGYTSPLLPLRDHVLAWVAVRVSLESWLLLSPNQSWELESGGMRFQHISFFPGEQVGVKPETAVAELEMLYLGL